MRARLGSKEHFAQHLIPKYVFGCRRDILKPCLATMWSQYSAAITEMTPVGIRTADGIQHGFDTIATGFEVSFKPRFPLIGRLGENLQDRWATETPKSYMRCVSLSRSREERGIPFPFLFVVLAIFFSTTVVQTLVGMDVTDLGTPALLSCTQLH
jgi:hypothetical protein